MRVEASAGIEIKGPVRVDGDISATGERRRDDIIPRDHIHDKVQSGGSLSGKAQP